MNKPLPQTLIEMLYEPLSDDNQRNTLFVEPHGNLVRKFDRQEFCHQVSRFARGMSATNLKRNCKVAMLCRNSIKATIAAFGNLLNGHVNVVLPLDVSVEEKLKALSSSRTECLIVDTLDSALPLLTNISNLPQLRQIVVLEEGKIAKHPEILCANWTEIMERSASQPDRLALLRQAIASDQEAFLYFQPDSQQHLRGSIRTHGQIIKEGKLLLDDISDSIAGFKRQHRLLCVLPFHHPKSFMLSAALPLMMDHSCLILDPAEIWKIENLSMRETLVIAEPAFFESVSQKIESQLQEAGGLREKLWNLAKERGLKNTFAERPGLFSQLLGFLLAPAMQVHTGGKLYLAIATDEFSDEATKAPFEGMGISFFNLDSKPQEMIGQRAVEN